MSDVQRSHLDAVARAERAVKLHNMTNGIATPGHSPAPLRLDVLYAEQLITEGIAEAESAVCEWLGITPTAGAHTAKRIGRIIRLLDRIAALDELARWLEAEAVRLDRLAARALDDAEDVRRLDVRCPYCSARSLRAFFDLEMVACVNPGCRCADPGCECQSGLGKRHIWLFDQWPELAKAGAA